MPGANRQPRPRVDTEFREKQRLLSQAGRGGRGGRGRGRGRMHHREVPSMPISDRSRQLIIDVLQHIATGGEAALSKDYFNSSSESRIVFVRNTQLSPHELLQLWFEKSGYPPDVTSQFLAEVALKDTTPRGFSSLSELEAQSSEWLWSSAWDLFAMMVFELGDDNGDEDNGDDDGEQEDDSDDAWGAEYELVCAMYGDIMQPLERLSDDEEVLVFQLHTADDVPAKLLVRMMGGTPLVQLRPPPDGLPLAPNARRAVLDAAVATITSSRGMPCLAALVGSCREALMSQRSIEKPPPSAAAASARAHPTTPKDVQRREFVQRLTEQHADESSSTSAAPNNASTPAVSPVVRSSGVLPSLVPYEVVSAQDTADSAVRRRFLRRDAAIDSSLLAEWTRLKHHPEVVEMRSSLPIIEVRSEFLRLLSRNRVVIVSGETGCGKTTQIPQFVLEDAIECECGSICNVIVTQPRRLAATAIALRVAEERREKIGGLVGYSIRLESKLSAETRLTYCTTGILLRRMQSDPFLGDVSHVIVDEIHERGVDTDFVLIMLRDLLAKRSDFKIVLMSATMNSKLFSTYFYDAPIVLVSGRVFPVECMFADEVVSMLHYTVDEDSPYAKESVMRRDRNRSSFYPSRRMTDIEEGLEDYHRDESAKQSPATARLNLELINYELIANLVEFIDEKYKFDGAIMIFMPGLAEIHRCVDEMKSRPRLVARCAIHNLHSTLGSAEQSNVFKRPARGTRKVVVGTNIMETSITIDDAVFVIDTGRYKENRYDAKRCLSQLVTCWVSKASAEQRKGRAGRVRPGFCFRLYTKAMYDGFANQQLCEMHRVPLEGVVLQITLLNLGDEMEYLAKALTPPEERAVRCSVDVLRSLGALTKEKRLTSLGFHLANLPIDVRIGKIIIHGALLRCVDAVLTIASCISVKSPFIGSLEDQLQVDAVRRSFSREYNSDHLTYYFAYQKWASIRHLKGAQAARRFADETFLSNNVLLQIQSTKAQFEHYLAEAGFLKFNGVVSSRRQNEFLDAPTETLDVVYEAGGTLYNENTSNPRCILACLVAGLYPNVARIQAKRGGSRKIAFDGSEVVIHPSSVNGAKGLGPRFSYPFLVYVEKIKTSQTFLRETSVVSPYMLILFGGELSFLQQYGELMVDNFVSFACDEKDGLLLQHLRAQLDSVLRDKINDPGAEWEVASSNMVRAIVQLLVQESTATALCVVERTDRHALTKPLREGQSSQGEAPAASLQQPPPKPQQFKTLRSCFNCGEVGHLSRDCPRERRAPKSSGGPTSRCFICGLLLHHPADCPMAKPTAAKKKASLGGAAGDGGES